MAGPTWRNEVCARTALEVGFNRPVLFAGRLPCPILVQVGTEDRVAPPGAARRTAAKAGPRAQLCEYPVDHFDVYRGPLQERALADQFEFFSSVLRSARRPAPRPADSTRPIGDARVGRGNHVGMLSPNFATYAEVLGTLFVALAVEAATDARRDSGRSGSSLFIRAGHQRAERLCRADWPPRASGSGNGWR